MTPLEWLDGRLNATMEAAERYRYGKETRADTNLLFEVGWKPRRIRPSYSDVTGQLGRNWGGDARP